MTENLKTILFIVAALVMLGLAWIARPSVPVRDSFNDIGQRFFEPFDPLKVTTLEVTRYDEKTGSPTAFKVTQKNGVWSIPSNEDYPADAEKHLAEAATAIVDVVKGSKASDKPSDHELYGVVDPTKAGAGATGVGTRVRLSDTANSTLADFIVGKTDKDNAQIRFVRVPDRDRIYRAKIDIEKLTTSFGDWIEKDLLKINTAEINGIVINSYSIDELNKRLNQGDLLRLSYDSAKSKWRLADQAETEDLKTEKLEELRGALQDLKIVDVHRKPAGLSAELKTQDEFKLDDAALTSLMSKGYYIVKDQLLSNEGEMIVSLKTGVQYVLRFGEIAETPAGSTSSDSATPGANRYLFLTAQFNQDLIPAPQMQPLPELPASQPAASQPAEGAETQGAESPPAESQPAVDPALAKAIEAARKSVEADNQKKKDDYDKQVKDGQDKVKDLNARFADWYYVISDDVYKKIRLTREDAIRKPGEKPQQPSPSSIDADQ